MSNDTVLADLHIRHAIKHLNVASDALRDGNQQWAIQNLNDARSDVWHARRHTKASLELHDVMGPD